MIPKGILEELKTYSVEYFEKDHVVAFDQISVYHGLYGWNTYKYKVSFQDTVKYIYIKVRKSIEDLEPTELLRLQQKIVESYENLQGLYENFKVFPGYSVIKPVACFPELCALVTEESCGIDVWLLVRSKARFYPSDDELNLLKNSCFKCGKWLAIFQQITRRTDLDLFDFNSMLELLDTYLSRLEQHQSLNFPPQLRKQVLEYCRQLIPQIPNEDRIVSGNHRDFAPINMLIHNDEITVLDIEPPEYGTIYRDATHFYHQLNTLQEVPIYRPATITQLQEAFVQGFGTSLDPSKKVVALYMIQNVIQSLLYLAVDRKNVNWYNRLYDKILLKKHISWLRKVCIA